MTATLQQKLQVRLAQKLILTPSLQLAIKLLPMTTLELSATLNQELIENPLLEELPSEEPPSADEDLQTEEARGADAAATDTGDTWADAEYEYFFGDYLDAGYRPHLPQELRELPPIENTLSTARSLADHLTWQLCLEIDDARMREIGQAIIGNLDENGYLAASVAEIEGVLCRIQQFDPVGVAARDLQECLLLQIRHLGLGGTTTETIVADHLRRLEHHQASEIARALAISVDEVKRHIEIITHLDPKPGARLGLQPSHVVTPDVHVVKVGDEYVVALNDEGLPRLRISPVYRRLLDKGAATSEATRAYVREKFRAALWLIKSVDQRQKTIHKVATSIIQFQRDFLDQGIEHLRPLVLRDVAQDIGMHESTVSRVVTNKYMHTPRGVFEMKYFFHSGIASASLGSVSSLAIKQRIRRIIEHEDSRKPLSDAKILRVLQDDGLELARRTIAKYREELKIPTSSRRKRVS